MDPHVHRTARLGTRVLISESWYKWSNTRGRAERYLLRVRLQPLLLIVPRMHSSSRSLAHIALFAALIAVLGLIPKIDLPLGVPVTAQTLGVMLAGCLLGPVRGCLAVLLFLGGVAMDCRCSLAEGAASACSWRPLPVS
jgi:ABC-type Co2+ transport system permease subunit